MVSTMTNHTHTIRAIRLTGHRTASLWASAALGRLFDTLCLWQDRARSRRWLMALDDRLLKDIGRSRTDAIREASKPFWKE